MRKLFVVFAATVLFTMVAEAHLCDDVFVQAKDNLAVKVDVRDGQLRISDTGTFRVYLLNTMDRDIALIKLEIVTDDFTSKVTPEQSWRNHPKLSTVNRGGKKQYFEVELTRKKKTKKGKYKISLLLYGKNKSKRQVYKTMDINAALANLEVPKASKSLKIDGKMKSTEWKKGLLFTSFHEYKKSGRFMQNFPASKQTRVRLFYDKDNIYCMVDLQKKKKGSSDDTVKIYLAKDQSSTPETITVDFKEKKATCSAGSEGIESKLEKSGTKMEIKIPLKLLAGKTEKADEEKKEEDEEKEDKDKKKKKKEDAKTPGSFWINITREAGSVTSYWKGNSSSAKNPVVFARIIFGKWH